MVGADEVVWLRLRFVCWIAVESRRQCLHDPSLLYRYDDVRLKEFEDNRILPIRRHVPAGFLIYETIAT